MLRQSTILLFILTTLGLVVVGAAANGEQAITATTRAATISKPSLGIIYCFNPDFRRGPSVVGVSLNVDADLVMAQDLMDTGIFSVVNATNLAFNLTTTEWMKQFDVILYYSSSSYEQLDQFGDNLADYLDEGGAVVTALYQTQTCCATTIAGGRFASEYQVIVPNIYDATYDSISVGDIYFPQHPIMRNFINFTFGLDHMVFANNSLEPNSYILSRFSDGTYIAVVKDAVGPGKRNRVDLGFYPVDLYSVGPLRGPQRNVTGAQRILIQSLLYALDTPYLDLSAYLPSNVTTCTTPNVTTLIPSQGLSLGLNVTSQSPAASSALQVGQTTLSFDINIPGPTVWRGSLTLNCPSATTNPATRAISALSALWTRGSF